MGTDELSHFVIPFAYYNNYEGKMRPNCRLEIYYEFAN